MSWFIGILRIFTFGKTHITYYPVQSLLMSSERLTKDFKEHRGSVSLVSKCAVPGPSLRSPHSSFHPRQWPPASDQPVARQGPSVKSDPISKPFVRTFYVQQFLFVFVVRHSSSVPHVPWLGHRGQKSEASSENVTPGQKSLKPAAKNVQFFDPSAPF